MGTRATSAAAYFGDETRVQQSKFAASRSPGFERVLAANQSMSSATEKASCSNAKGSSNATRAVKSTTRVRPCTRDATSSGMPADARCQPAIEAETSVTTTASNSPKASGATRAASSSAVSWKAAAPDVPLSSHLPELSRVVLATRTPGQTVAPRLEASDSSAQGSALMPPTPQKKGGLRGKPKKSASQCPSSARSVPKSPVHSAAQPRSSQSFSSSSRNRGVSARKN
mmetsp:Transcript_60726/g.169782  ORF Transcript_60726/g.169782 Transcript_60726/m.169782 type:complete len:228 (-) Transcript_60726:146-829(-)